METKSKQVVRYGKILKEIEREEEKIVQLRGKIGEDLFGKYFQGVFKTEESVGRILGHDCYGDLIYLQFHCDEVPTQREKQTTSIDEIYFTRESFSKYDPSGYLDEFYNEITREEFIDFVQKKMTKALEKNTKELVAEICQD